MIEKGEITNVLGRRQISDLLYRNAKWPANEARSYWDLEEHRNILLDLTKGIQYLREVRDTIISGFTWTCQNGPLCEEPIRGIKAKLMDVQLHEDPVHRGPAQVMPATRKAILGSFLEAEPVLLEPIYKIGVSVSQEWVGDVTSIVTRKRGRITSSEQRGPITMINGFIPVSETFGLSADMRSATSGHAFWQCSFDHWEKVPDNLAIEIIRGIRERRGLNPEVPPSTRFIDEL
jgi:elongation factor 2